MATIATRIVSRQKSVRDRSGELTDDAIRMLACSFKAFLEELFELSKAW